MRTFYQIQTAVYGGALAASISWALRPPAPDDTAMVAFCVVVFTVLTLRAMHGWRSS